MVTSFTPQIWQLNDLTCSFGIAFMTSGQIDFSSRSCEIWQSYRHQWRSLWYVWFLFRSPIAGQYIYWWWCYDIIEGPDHVLLLQLNCDWNWIVFTWSGHQCHNIIIDIYIAGRSTTWIRIKHVKGSVIDVDKTVIFHMIRAWYCGSVFVAMFFRW